MNSPDATLVSSMSPRRTSPSAGRRNPTMISSSDVLPEPEAPKIAVTRRSSTASISSVKCASGSRTPWSSTLMGRASAKASR
jgi:hypothetical protein